MNNTPSSSYSHIRVGASLGFDMEFHNSIINQIREERRKKQEQAEKEKTTKEIEGKLNTLKI